MYGVWHGKCYVIVEDKMKTKEVKEISVKTSFSIGVVVLLISMVLLSLFSVSMFSQETGNVVKIDVNRDGQAALERLPGIGKVIAGRIIEVRKVRFFTGLLDLIVRVKGIGPKRGAALKGLVVFGKAERRIK
jgi:DNA uptake protein ComE-like DNA-binding protein